jgi:hypothetical protein
LRKSTPNTRWMPRLIALRIKPNPTGGHHYKHGAAVRP